jgi:hypothetical protein
MSISQYLCLLSFALCYFMGRRSLVSGLVAIVAVGYVYGIVRANVPETFSHFIFDAGVIGVYTARLFRKPSSSEQFRVGSLKPWLEFLIVWPLLVFLFPIQDMLIQVVGLRGSIFLLPFILLGARMTGDDRYHLAVWIAGLNLLAFAVAGSEYLLGLDKFYPHNQVTALLYLSKDIVGHSAYRIPSSFVNAHAFGGTMIIGLPLLIGAVVQKHKTTLHLQLLVAGIGAALVGVLMSGARTHFLIGSVIVIVATFSLRSRFGYALGWLILLCGVGWVASSEQRLQRFMELRDTQSIAERISWSVNMNFFEIAAQYPFGNGLGGGGTSIPYFLQNRISNPVLMENEYARIMIEQGITGLLIWIAFILWLVTRRDRAPADGWYLGRRLAWVACSLSFVTGLIGTGLLTSVPHSCLLLLLVGWVGARQPVVEAEREASQKYLDMEKQVAGRQLVNG